MSEDKNKEKFEKIVRDVDKELTPKTINGKIIIDEILRRLNEENEEESVVN